MFYVKTKLNGDITIELPLYEDEIITYCGDCKKELQMDSEWLAEILKECDLSGTVVYCSDCTQKRREEKQHENN
ncbi:hypothetical protein M5W76_18020 [Paenibacillus larvae]|uniref:Uncharacterized protein n=5 Tax=Fernvirus TaxID=2843380 RepID=A0A2I7SCV3_9CAUD|nr:hypothetical protein [Paenibacillus larvae]YP_009836307.1 hypothetical protein HWB43_gp50 [Paenibacillus phage BN12]YP_009836456.1 hypothetical protein HWB45_gp47 [Paenibacillus phage Pagassa]YP_009838741.1 hypothetical protein HWB71_gp41 [Paenibacillus phage Kawika]YP_009838878.1 hypothetical protein HWB73_gp42 [Paenibacillus phage Eltigre]AXF39602.1 hypothetical protein HONEYBEAR_43 [Paenibacillus phage Honeybear]AXF40546.1 hypothetical protein TOOTHLESS_41 [Paenibacillus phage Toothless